MAMASLRAPGAIRHLGSSLRKAMPFIGSGESSGFGGGVPALLRQVLLAAWRQETDFERFLEQPAAQHLASEARHSWWSLFEVASTRDSHYRSTLLTGRGDSTADGPFAALTHSIVAAGVAESGVVERVPREDLTGPMRPDFVAALAAGCDER
jgi:hypothetical protein